MRAQIYGTVWLAALGLCLMGCRSQENTSLLNSNPPVGVPCAVELRPPLPNGYTALHLKGTLKAASDKWVVLYNDKKPEEGEVWIPREAIFAVITGKSAADFKGFDLK